MIAAIILPFGVDLIAIGVASFGYFVQQTSGGFEPPDAVSVKLAKVALVCMALYGLASLLLNVASSVF